eukprot:m.32572 g.32572  ORF g.32572 m.32572 type:complete len:150 (-) comp16665_c0_seq1:1028-1477(-)
MSGASTSLPLPSKAEDVDAKWLTAALQGQLLDLDEIVTSFELKQIGMEQGFTCSLFAFQITTNKANQKSVVMKITDKPEMIAGVFANELNFYKCNKSHTPASIPPCKSCAKTGTAQIGIHKPTQRFGSQIRIGVASRKMGVHLRWSWKT